MVFPREEAAEWWGVTPEEIDRAVEVDRDVLVLSGPDSLDAAWAEAEAALPEEAARYMADDPEGDWTGAAWSLTVTGPFDNGTYAAVFVDATEGEMIPGAYGRGATPAAALHALAAKLREVTP